MEAKAGPTRVPTWEELGGSVPAVRDYSSEEELGVQMLISGYPVGFVEFFKLTHRPPRVQVNFDTGKEEVVEPGVLARGQLEAVVENLVAGEEGVRGGDGETVVGAYTALADYFEGEGDYDTAVAFHKAAWVRAASDGDAEAEGGAQCRLGMCYEQMSNVDAAVGYYERYHLLSTSPEAVTDACSHLVKCYWIQAERAEARGNYDAAIGHYKACMEKAAEGGDTRAEGETNYRIGLTCEHLDQTQQSILYFKSYLDVCRRTGDVLGEGTACFALAKAHQKLDDLPTAIHFLETYVELAERTNQASALSEAACSLGLIFNQQGEYEKAVKYFDKNFDMALKIGDPHAIDNARVLLGISRGHENMSEYMHLVDNSSPSLLEWKSDFDPAASFAKPYTHSFPQTDTTPTPALPGRGEVGGGGDDGSPGGDDGGESGGDDGRMGGGEGGGEGGGDDEGEGGGDDEGESGGADAGESGESGESGSSTSSSPQPHEPQPQP